MRLFLGLPIPPELAQALTRLTRAIELPKGRRTASENLHLTLARFHGPLRLNKSQHALPPSLQRSFRADTVNLYRSHPTPTGAHYEILAQKKSTKPDKPIPHR